MADPFTTSNDIAPGLTAPSLLISTLTSLFFGNSTTPSKERCEDIKDRGPLTVRLLQQREAYRIMRSGFEFLHFFKSFHISIPDEITLTNTLSTEPLYSWARYGLTSLGAITRPQLCGYQQPFWISASFNFASQPMTRRLVVDLTVDRPMLS